MFALILFWRAALLKVPIKLYLQGRKHMWLVYWWVYDVQRKVHYLPSIPVRNDLRDLLRMLLFRDWHSSRMHGLHGSTGNVLILVFGQVHSERRLLLSRLQRFLHLMQNRLLRSQQSLRQMLTKLCVLYRLNKLCWLRPWFLLETRQFGFVYFMPQWMCNMWGVWSL